MAKRGALSKEEKDYINQNLDSKTKEIAEHLDRTESTIQKFIDRQKKSSKTKNDSQKAGNFMARNKKYGSVSMTQKASITGDESREKVTPPAKKPLRQRGTIHVIKEDK